LIRLVKNTIDPITSKGVFVMLRPQLNIYSIFLLRNKKLN